MAKTPTKCLKNRPAFSDEGKEEQCISLAMDLAEQRLRNGTASSQEVVHFLRLGSTRAKIDLENAKLENELIKAKTEAYRSSKNIEELYSQAISAMQIYQGHAQESNEDEDNQDF